MNIFTYMPEGFNFHVFMSCKLCDFRYHVLLFGAGKYDVESVFLG